MLEPEIRYCATEDGVSIAYWSLGEGPPLVYIAEPVLTSTAGDYKTPTTRHWHERLASGRTVIRFDHRGTGLSSHNGAFSLEALCLDLAAVVDALELPSFDLWGDLDGGIVAAAYAASHAGRVSHLILWNSWPRAQDVPESETLRTLDRLIDLNWPLYARTVATLDSGWSAEEAADYARYIETGCDARIARAFVNATWEFDIESLLPAIACPTLVLHRRGHRYMPLDLGRRLAAGIPGARLSVIEGTSFHPWFEHSDTILELVDAFAPPESNRSTPGAARLHTRSPGTAVILFLDIAGSTALTERMGDAAFRAASRALDERLRDAIRNAGGAPVEGKVMGDGVMATFSSAREAIDAALRCSALSADSELRLHIGVHAGDVIREPGNVYGGAVNIASRICDASAPGEVLVSDVVRGMARSSAGVAFEDRGEREMKGVGEPVRVYAVRTGDA